MPYPKVGADSVPSQPSFPALERDVLGFWEDDQTFQASVDARPAGENGSNEFVFYDGPPFANGLPHYGHLLTGYVKDLVPRYRTMRGQHVERRFGWDTHGLPAEVEAEKQLGFSSKSDIEAFGIDKFNDACRTSVLRYTDQWREYVTKQARWVDFDNDYKTLDLDYMESVMWAFKTLWDKGLVYEGFRVLWYCWRCETPLSNTETKMDDTYRDRQDPAVTVGLRLETGELALVWTTTPWTLPSNLAAAVHPDVDYVTVEANGEKYLLAEARVAAYARELGEEPPVVARCKGSDLVGRRYTPPFDFFLGRDNAHQVLPADYVTTEDGTGIVHIAPAFGEDDKAVTDAAGIEVVVPVDPHGCFTAEVPPYAGQHVFEANKVIIRDLKDAGLLLRHETYDHPYPHCWRCDNPLIQRAVSSWFVAVTRFRDRMVELNQQINWAPEHIKDGQFGKWLSNARDWNISRNRFWGSPIPVWVSDDPEFPRVDVYGSLDELERDFGVRPTDLHRPAIDELTRPNPDDPSGKSTMRRVPEVLDCWFESGSMSFAQVHYPFENADWFENHYPGDFIVEYNGQTRGWFYTLHVLATALFDRPAFRNCVAHGIVLGDDGQKMSKSRKNYPDVNEVFERDGSDAMRWFLMSSPILRGGDLVVTERGIRDGVRQAVLPLWNSWYFLALYANAEGVEGAWRTDSSHVLDRYALAKTHDLVARVTGQLDEYDISGACASVRDFLEVLTNWYVRRSRDRFWAGDQDAVDTLHTVLEVVSRVAAPLLPMTTEVVWRGLTGGRSVHLTDYPEAADLPADPELVAAMDAVRQVASTALSLRKANKLRVRLPLAKLVIASPSAGSLEGFREILSDEVNVKAVELTDDVDAHGHFQLAVNARAAGPRLGPNVQKVIKAVKAGDWSEVDGRVVAAGIELFPQEYEQRLVATDPAATAALPGGAGLVVLDTEVTEELAAEGVARDLVRVVQQARKDAGLDVSDRIALTVDAPEGAAADAARAFEAFVREETLAVEVAYGAVDGGSEGAVGDGAKVRVLVVKAG
ncbi:isoleucine--tRNA ligase [Actinosynnema mirum]|uniref:Isoleucine--tRNA ligase n=1 Tax=Actinosynnema mirum (strain ATCC 29888 / DSM 43827 / JCM 3225 / NBRC 14064 / NCIMB 13271 / NRRL B-12336 / IMRU 3971 / 101) TaxID=446462 RepID=C6WDC9_ACTMD|nr:isoleucine--tRNA ligase [Actinosynnema mirum]ACU39566.1 isoleucyl-tRNA synthetase [Actinosynnema mirum DSM 43827]